MERKSQCDYRVGTGAYNFNPRKRETRDLRIEAPSSKRVQREGGEQFTPYLFGKGDWQDISRLRLEVNYDDIKGKTFKTVCEYSETDQPLPRTGTEG